MRPVNITVRIERLVLDGVPLTASDGELVGAAVQAGLARLLAAGSTALPARSDGVPAVLRAPVITVPAGGEPAELGDAIAAAVHQGIWDDGEGQSLGWGGGAP